MNSLTTPQLLFLATAIILAHLWHRRWFLTTHVSPLPDNASAGSPSSPAVVSENQTGEASRTLMDLLGFSESCAIRYSAPQPHCRH
ncbi:hypothetical protein DER44DRAFT_60721 [Fusarium oxysporum]|nr:hypothetical protein DER44DRAFT_60721 [Fusarium oxysporum]